MNYRKLGKTNLMVSEIGLGGEWLEKKSEETVKEIICRCEENGINILDCWMSEPNVRTNIGKALKGKRERWYIQGHIGSTWENRQYNKTRDAQKAANAFEDLLNRFQTDYIDLGMIHYVDDEKDFNNAFSGDFAKLVQSLKSSGKIKHIGLSTHNPLIAEKAVHEGLVEMIMFSINPAFDMLPASDDINTYFAEEYDENLLGIAPERTRLYKLCEQENVGITVMKGFAGGRLFNKDASPFKVALTPAMCIHYCLTRPGVASVMAGFDSVSQVDEALLYETASENEKDYATVLSSAPKHAFSGECTYCGHCKPCPMNIDIAMVNKLLDLALMQTEVPSSVRAHYNEMENTAAKCIECGGCEERCPFGVSVIEKMRKAKSVFE